MLLGREGEQRAIAALMSAARLGQSGVLVLGGQAGIGKSALLEHAAREAAGFRLLRLVGIASEHDLPFAGLAQLLRPIADRIPRLPEPQVEALEIALALRPGTGVDRFAVAAGVLTLVASAAEEGPIGLIVDDAQLVDQASAAAIAFMSRRLLADPVFVLVGVRSPVGEPWVTSDLPLIEVAGLTAQAAAALAEATAPGLPGSRRDLVVELAGGNPLAVRELVRDPERLARRSPDFPVPLPEIVAEVFGQRADVLAPADRQVLLLAAVADGDLAVLARVCDVAGLDLSAVERAEEHGLLRAAAPGRVEFAHPLERAAVYAGAGPSDRRRLHALVAAALPDGAADLRAWHRDASVIGIDAAVADELQAVGHRASARGAHAVAATAFERAARLSATDPHRDRRLLASGEAAWFAGEDARARPLLQEIVQHQTEPVLRARARGLLGLVEGRGGRLSEARDLLLAAAAEAVQASPEQALLLYAEAVDACFYLLDAANANRAASAAERLLEADGDRAGPVGPGTRGAVRIAIGMARILGGEPGGEDLRQGVALLAQSEDRPQLQSGWEVLGALFLRDSANGRDLVAEALEQRRASSSVGTLPHLLFHLARDDAGTDRWTSASAGYGEAIALAREFGQPVELGSSLAGLAWLSARQGQVDEPRAMAAEVDELGRRHGLRLARAWTRFALAELDLSLGDTEAAAKAFAELDSWVTGLGALDVDLSPVPELVESLCRLGRKDDAAAAAGQYLQRARRKGQPWSLARAARVRGMLAAPADREPLFAEARAGHARTLDRFEEARTRLVHGELLRRDRRRVDARPELRAALDAFEQLGAHAWADRALDELTATGATARRREAGPITALTARELQIALMLARGRTTREAAAALFLSPKTVEYHLRHVYTKLGIGSRAELAAQVLDQNKNVF